MEELTQAMKEEMIKRRLQSYQAKLYDMNLDKIAFQAAGDTEAIAGTQLRIDKMQLAYEAIKAFQTEEAAKANADS